MSTNEHLGTTVPVTFQGDALDVARQPDGDVGVSLRRLLNAYGIDVAGQPQPAGGAS